MKLCIDISSALAHGSGVSRYVRELSLALLDQLEAEQIHLFHNTQSLARLPNRLSHLSRSSVPLNNKLWRLLLLTGARRQVERTLDGRVFDVFHGPDCLIPNVRTARVITIHDVSGLSHPQFHTRYNRMYLRLALPIMVQRAAKIIVDSESTRSEAARLLPGSEGKITVIYPGIDHLRFHRFDHDAARAQIRAELGIDQPFVLAVGTLEPRKNLLTLIRAFLAVPPDIAPLLVLTGAKGWGEQLPGEITNTRNSRREYA